MTIVLNHTIVRARDKQRSARFFADLLSLEVGAPAGPFLPVRVNGNLTFDFAAVAASTCATLTATATNSSLSCPRLHRQTAP